MIDRELDAMIAEHLFGWRWFCWKGLAPTPSTGEIRWILDPKTTGDHLRLCKKSDMNKRQVNGMSPAFSSKIDGAWKVVEKMKDRQWTFALCSLIKNRWRAEFGGSRKRTHIWADADNAPRAICLAALASIHVKIS